MKKIFFNLILLGTLLMSTLISAQVILTALEAPSNNSNNNGGGNNDGGNVYKPHYFCTPGEQSTITQVTGGEAICKDGYWHTRIYRTVTVRTCVAQYEPDGFGGTYLHSYNWGVPTTAVYAQDTSQGTRCTQ